MHRTQTRPPIARTQSRYDIARLLGDIPVVYGVRCTTLKSSDMPLYHVDVIPASETIGSDADGVWNSGQKIPKGGYDSIAQQATSDAILKQERKLK